MRGPSCACFALPPLPQPLDVTTRSERTPLVWVPLVLLGIAAATLFPFQLARCGRSPWEHDVGALDVVQNVLLFIPVGLALGRRRLIATLALACLVSATAETLQMWLPRSPNVVDIASNVTGAGVGWILVPWWQAHVARLWRRPWIVWAALALGLLVLAGSAMRLRGTDFSDWEPAPLVLANDPTGNRPWFGTIEALAIYDHPDRTGAPVSNPRPWRRGGPVLWLRFAPPVEGRLDGPSGPRPLDLDLRAPPAFAISGAGLTTAPPGVVLPRIASDHVLHLLQHTGQMTLAVRAMSDSWNQHGPAHIVSFALNPLRANFMLGQLRSELLFRVRSPAVGWGGRPRIKSRGARMGSRRRPASFVATYDGERAQLRVDGRCVADVEPGLLAAPLAVGRGLGLAVVVLTALAVLAGLSLCRPGWNRLARILMGIACAVVVWGVMVIVGGLRAAPGFGPDSVLLGAAAVAAALFGALSQAGAQRALGPGVDRTE